MGIVLQTEAPPLHRDNTGALRVGTSRVLLDVVVRAFEAGATPETIAQQYPTATLADIYGAIAYYLRHRAEVSEYLAERELIAQDVRLRIDAQQGDLTEVRNRLLRRKQSSSPAP